MEIYNRSYDPEIEKQKLLTESDKIQKIFCEENFLNQQGKTLPNIKTKQYIDSSSY